MRRQNMLTLLAPKELGLSQKYGKKQGGYYLTPLRQAHRLLEAREGFLLQDDIPHMATHSDPIVATSHSSTHGMQTQIPVDKPPESILPYEETIQPSCKQIDLIIILCIIFFLNR